MRFNMHHDVSKSTVLNEPGNSLVEVPVHQNENEMIPVSHPFTLHGCTMSLMEGLTAFPSGKHLEAKSGRGLPTEDLRALTTALVKTTAVKRPARTVAYLWMVFPEQTPHAVIALTLTDLKRL
jgi:hypothetical protein